MIPRPLTAGLAVLALAGGLARAAPDDPPASQGQTPKEQYQSVLDEYQKAQGAFSQAYSEAKTDEDRNKVFQEKYPDPSKFAARFLAIAEANPDDPAAVDALVWTLQLGSQAQSGVKAIERLAARHAADPRVARAVPMLVHAYSPAAEKLLRAVVEQGKDRQAQGDALLALGQFLNARAELLSHMKDNPERIAEVQPALERMGLDKATFDRLLKSDPATFTKEAETCYERVVKEFDDVAQGRGTLGKTASGELNAIRTLGVGKPCPEIVGEDIDGKSFKLSDYKGNVVVVDFWGDW